MNKRIPYRFIHGAVVLVAAGFSVSPVSMETQPVAPYLRNENYAIQLGMYDLFTSTRADVVMLGNSLTYNANWNEILNRSNIANRGIASDITSGYFHRLGYVYRLRPRICFIEGGVNDLYSNDSVNSIVRNYAGIIDSLQSHHIIPVIQSTLFVAATYAQATDKNGQIQALNNWLTEFALKNRIEFLDVNRLVSTNGFLREELTYDGIHLNARGYALWAPEVERILIRYKL